MSRFTSRIAVARCFSNLEQPILQFIALREQYNSHGQISGHTVSLLTGLADATTKYPRRHYARLF